MRMYVEGGKAGESGKAVFDRAEVLKVLRAGGVIGCGQALRLRIRYFGDGLVLGSEEYVNGIFRKFRSHFGPKRQTGARKLGRLPFVELRTMRDLEKECGELRRLALPWHQTSERRNIKSSRPRCRALE